MGPDPRALHRFARAQHGAFSRMQARSSGFTPKMIQTRVARGDWLPVEQHVFVIASSARTWLQRCAAATLRHPAAALSHDTAAAHLGLDGFRPGPVHIVVPPTANHASELAVVHRSRHHDFIVHKGIRTTTFAQVMVQLAASAHHARLQAALHSGVHQNPTRLDDLRRRLGELRRRRMPGLGRIVDLLDELDGQPPTESELERLLWATLQLVPGLPPIARQFEIVGHEGTRMRVDAFVPEWRLLIEADGRTWHTLVADFERDRWRDAEAASQGIHVMRFSWNRLVEDVDGVVDQIARFGTNARRSA